MSGRKLSRRQKWRIEKIQQERLDRAQKKAEVSTRSFNSSELGPEQLGTIVAHYGQTILVEDKERSAVRCAARANLESLVCGDQIVFRKDVQDQGVIEALKERQSCLKRPDTYGKLKPVAANIDQIIIVVAPEPVPHANLIDRYIVASETLSIKPSILLNKIDLLDQDNQAIVSSLANIYTSLGYQVIKTSARQPETLRDQIAPFLDNKTSVFVGQSGVGKSSIINALLPEAGIRTAALSAAAGKGRHTTTTAQLYHLGQNGHLIDSPGIREFALWHISESDLFDGFIEFRPYRGMCKFRDCRHEAEPGCAVLDAVEKGHISQERIASYFNIRRSLNENEVFE